MGESAQTSVAICKPIVAALEPERLNMKFIKDLSIRQLSSRFSVGFALVVVCIAAIGFVNVKTAWQLHADWAENPNDARLKGTLLHNLNSAIGYGGAIHQFKNFVIRKDTPRLDKVRSGFDSVQETIQKYRTFTVSAKESQALDDISNVFRQYSEATTVITAMAKNSMSTNDIDKAVKIDDSPAIAGIHFLETSIGTQLEAHDQSMDSKLLKIYSLTMYGSIASTVMLCLLLTSLLITFRSILQQIGGEPRRINEISRRIANGDHVDVPVGADKNSGILGAILSMQLILRERTEAEQASSAINERLKQALDNASSNVMVADTENIIVFANKSTALLFADKQQQIRSAVPNFKAKDIVGSNIDLFHITPLVQNDFINNLKDNHRGVVDFGDCYFSISISPVLMNSGERIGTIIEWFDKTEEIKNEAEVQQLIEAAAQGDLGRRVNMQESSEFFRKLGHSMNELMDVNDRAVGEVQRVFASVAGGDLTARVEGQYQGVYQQLKDDANAMVSQLTGVIREVKNGAMIVAAASSELISTNKNLNSTAQDGAKQAGIASVAASNVMQNVDAVANAASDLEASVTDISRNVNEAVEVASEAVILAQSTNIQVRKLTTSSSDIGNVIKVIDSIAEQTNLLALNATIEAARAGDAGKGFAVVANEVKELAKGTASATDEIAQKVKAIQDDSDTAVQAIGNISKIIETISNYQNTISEAVRNQNLATQRISKNAGEAAQVNVEITRTSERVSEGAKSTVNGLTELQSSAEELARMAVDLSDLVEGFQVDEFEHRKVT